MKLLRTFGILALLLGLLAGTASAAPSGPPGAWSSDITLLNLESSTATVALDRYNQFTGGAADTGTSITIPGGNTISGNGSLYYNPSADPNFPGPFTGSVVVSSDRQLAATVTLWNNLTGSQFASDAYSGVSAASGSVTLPIVMAHLGSWNTRMSIQNAGTAMTNVTITYIGANAPAPGSVVNLPPNQMAIVDQVNLPSSVQNFNGSAIVTASQPLAIEVDEYKTGGGVLVSYAGVPSSSAATKVLMPGFIAQGVWVTDFTIVNTEAGQANVSVTFSGSGKTVSGPIAGNGSAYVFGPGNVIPSGWTGAPPVQSDNYYGSATITSNTKVVVVYNISNGGAGGNNYSIGYVGQAASAALPKVAVPLIENKYSTGWLTTFSVQSADGSPANLSMQFSGNKAPNCNPCTANNVVAATFDQTADGFVPVGFIGGVTITANKPIVVIADQNKVGGAGDTAAGFPGIPTP